MRKALLLVLVPAMLVLSPSVFAQDKPVEPSGSSQSTSGRKFNDLSPEEQAKLKAKWQSASAQDPPKPEGTPQSPSTGDKAKVRDKMRARGADIASGTQGQVRKEAVKAEMSRLQEQHRMTVGELQAIKQLAVKENAKETANALTQLIAKHESQYNQQMQVLQRKMKLLQGDQETKAGTADQTPVDKPAKLEPKKNESTPQDTGAKPK